VKLAIIAAIGKNRVIGKDGKIPWHISEDLKRFKRLTTGHTVLMGRRTWESLGKPLVNRRNVVLTSKPIPNTECYPTIESALEALRDQGKVFVIGGARVYADLFPKADELYLTFVDATMEGDAYFPPFEDELQHKFRIVARDRRAGYEFVDYVRTA
jgi:dihydrofolate reductase